MKKALTTNEAGMAVVTALLVLMLASGLMAGMFAALLANQQAHATDRDQSVAYAAAHAGLEKLTAGLAELFVTNFSPDSDDIDDLSDYPPEIAGFEYTAPDGTSGYDVDFTEDADGNPQSIPSADITTGPFEGFKGLITPYIITVTARSETGRSEVRLRRELQTVAVPVFQFGVFGEKSLGFHAGPSFDFGGRVHTNESLYLASGGASDTASTLTFRDKITAFTQVVRNQLMNGAAVNLSSPATQWMGKVLIPKVIGGAPSTYRALTYTPTNESSGTTAAPWSGWKNLSESVYNANIRTELTGAKKLNLPLVSQGAQPIDLIRRPAVNSDEDTENAVVYGQRYFAQASLRILLSDRAADLTNLPTVTADAPVDLSTFVPATGMPAVALSPGPEPEATPIFTRITQINGATNPTFLNGGGAAATLTIQTATNAGFTAGTNTAVPTWLKWHNTNGLVITSTGVALTCAGMNATQLLGCGNHTALAVGASITVTRPDGSTFSATVGPNVVAANATPINVTGFPNQMTATRTFFVGEDPVTCTGFQHPTNVANAATQLTGCTWPSGTTLNLNDAVYTGATTSSGTRLVHGFIKIEKQDDDGNWTDVTAEILALGFSDANQQGSICADPTPDAVIRLQRFRDNGLIGTNACSGTATTTYHTSRAGLDFWPLNLYDAREGSNRPNLTGMNAGGLISYVALDVRNFRRWVEGAIPASGNTGTLAKENNGYIVYFSDRRGDHNEDHLTVADIETGEYGFEDAINPAVAAWASNMTGRGTSQTGENFNENATLETYGEDPSGVAGVVVNAVAGMGFDANSRPWTNIAQGYTGRGRLARPVLFRRALKLINGGLASGTNQLPAEGFTVTSENPVYVQGNYNASLETATSAADSTTAWTTLAEPNRAAAIIADAITLLSRIFNDASTFTAPNDSGARVAASTAYRFAMTTGKSVPFTKPTTWGDTDTGSDGGVHNFMRFLENWGGQNVRYRGSMVSLFYSRQATGIYRANGDVYGAPNRYYNFDTDFLVPSLLPPGTPMFRDINTLKFRQILRPNQ